MLISFLPTQIYAWKNFWEHVAVLCSNKNLNENDRNYLKESCCHDMWMLMLVQSCYRFHVFFCYRKLLHAKRAFWYFYVDKRINILYRQTKQYVFCTGIHSTCVSHLLWCLVDLWGSQSLVTSPRTTKTALLCKPSHCAAGNKIKIAVFVYMVKTMTAAIGKIFWICDWVHTCHLDCNSKSRSHTYRMFLHCVGE